MKAGGIMLNMSGLAPTLGYSLLAVADLGAIIVPQKSMAVEIGVIISDLNAGVALDATPLPLVLSFDLIRAGTAEASRVSGGVGTVSSAVDRASGYMLTKKIAVILGKGDLIVVKVTTAATAGNGYPYVIMTPEGTGLVEPYEIAVTA